MNNPIPRRSFLRQSACGAAGLLLAPTILPASTVMGGNGRTLPNSRVNLGVIGVGGMGSSHMRSNLGYNDVRVVAVCDVRKAHRDEAKALVDQQYGDGACAAYNDFRELLARPDVDAIVMAAPDHWHVLIGIEAAKRGKAMYYEKPVSYTVQEAQVLRETLQRYNTVFQLGTQQRSDYRFRFAVELVRNGRLGELKRIVLGSASFDAVPEQSVEPVPEGLDYDLWLGPAPEAPYTTLRCTRNWTLIRDYSLGCLSGAWGIHHVDIAQWAMDADASGPVTVEGTGSIPDGLYDTYQHFEVEQTYANGAKLLHLDHLTARKRIPLFGEVSNSMGILFEGTEGWFYVNRDSMIAEPKSLLRTTFGPSDIRLPVSNNHRRNFIDAVRLEVDPMCPIGPGVKSEIVCQQAEIALRLGRKLQWDNDLEQFIDDPEANAQLSSPMRGPWHL